MTKRVVVIGGGASGFFAAINYATLHPSHSVIILEKSSHFLQKVKISGGGRCNVTHYCFNPTELIKNYPRGNKQLLGPFTRFGPMELIRWFEERGVRLKNESDGRMFPISDSSLTIIDCFLKQCEFLKIDLRRNFYVTSLSKNKCDNSWLVTGKNSDKVIADAVLVTAGSSESIWQLCRNIGHKIVQPVPSLFSFQTASKEPTNLSGVSLPNAQVEVISYPKLRISGSILFTHWGFSGPAILKLSALAARELAKEKYKFSISVNWLSKTQQDISSTLLDYKLNNGKKSVVSNTPFHLPKRFWDFLLLSCKISEKNWADLSKSELNSIAVFLTRAHFEIKGKSTYKDEFVTAGGVSLSEINFKTMESKICSGLFFAGEVLDIDAVTGGFNFQAAWTTGWIAAQSM